MAYLCSNFKVLIRSAIIGLPNSRLSKLPIRLKYLRVFRTVPTPKVSALKPFWATTGEALSFATKTRFANGYPLTVLISTNYDGTVAGIGTASWTPLTFTAPTTDDVFVNSGLIDLSTIESNNVRIAFKYNGSKAGVTTTLQLDNVKITKN